MDLSIMSWHADNRFAWLSRFIRSAFFSMIEPMKGWISCLAVLLFAAMLAQGLGEPKREAPELRGPPFSAKPRVYIAPDRSFQLDVPAHYGLQTGAEKTSGSYIPVCREYSIVCITPPPGQFKGATFQDASLEVFLLDAQTASTCASSAALRISGAPEAPTMENFKTDSKHPSRVFDGTKFLHGFDREGASSSDIETNRYRGFKNGKCYDLAIHVAYGDFAVYDPGTIKEFTRHDIELVTEELTRILDSFRSLGAR